MFCYNCGSQLPNGAKFCPSCGVKISTTANFSCPPEIKQQVSTQENTGVVFNILNREIMFSSNVKVYNEIRGPLADCSIDALQSATEWAKSDMHSLDDVFQSGTLLAVDLIHKALEMGVRVLMKRGIDDISVSRLLDVCWDSVDPNSFMEYFFQKGNEIEQYAEELALKRDIKRSSRSRWQGGGFGVAGALKGAVTAGALNMGTSAVRGIGDFITDSGDRSTIEKMKKVVVETSEARDIYVNGVYKSCLGVFDGVYQVLVARKIIAPVMFDSERISAQMENFYNLERDQLSDEEQNERIIPIELKGIEANPYYLPPYLDLYLRFQADRTDILKIAKYFHVDYFLRQKLERVLHESLEKLRPLPEDSYQTIESKQAQLFQIENEYPGLNLDVSDVKRVLDERYEIKRAENEARNLKESIDQAIAAKEIDRVWELACGGNTYAVFALEKYYENDCKHFIETHNGAGIEQKLSDVIHMAEEGNVVAQYLFSYVLFKANCDKLTAAKIICALADNGFPAAMAMRGFWATQGQEYCGQISNSEGLQLLELAAKNDDPTALAWLGIYYNKGECGLPRDKRRGELLLTKAATYGQLAAIKELKGGSGCFITTAVCEYFGKSDDCYELTAFRNFRDNWLLLQPDGPMLVQQYYQIAPLIVQRINLCPNRSSIYQKIWNYFLEPCLKYIKQHDFISCKEQYIKMVKYLSNYDHVLYELDSQENR